MVGQLAETDALTLERPLVRQNPEARAAQIVVVPRQWLLLATRYDTVPKQSTIVPYERTRWCTQ